MMVSIDTMGGKGLAEETKARIESQLEVKSYIQDLRFALNHSELLGLYGNTTTFVMSFHFAEKAFTPGMFPYKKK